MCVRLHRLNRRSTIPLVSIAISPQLRISHTTQYPSPRPMVVDIVCLSPLAAPAAGVRATRFVALAQVGNPGKQKFLHALGLAPASSMTPEQLAQQPEGCTPSPYELAAKRPASAQEVRLGPDVLPRAAADAVGRGWMVWSGSAPCRPAVLCLCLTAVLGGSTGLADPWA